MRCIVVLTVAALLCGVVFGEEFEKKPLADVKLNYKKLTGEKHVYGMKMLMNKDGKGKAIGDALAEAILNEMFKAKMSMSAKAGKDNVQMDYTLDMGSRKMEFSCLLEKSTLLCPISMKAKMFKKGELKQSDEIQFADGKMLTKMGEKQIEKEFAKNTVMLNSLFYIIPQLPNKKGVSYVFDNFSESMELRSQKPKDGGKFRIDCMGKHTINIGGKDVKCVKYSVKGVRRPMDFLVDEKGLVQAMTTKDSLLILMPKDAKGKKKNAS